MKTHDAARSPQRSSHPEFPLERVCSYAAEPFQLRFARNARQHFLTREDVEVVASHGGLTIRAETEAAIDAALALLKDLYGPRLHIGPPTVLYHPLASLLGYAASLEALTAGSARHSLWLSHYAPLVPEPPGGCAA